MWSDRAEPADPAAVATVVDLAWAAQPRCGDVVVVAIDGRSGAGKSTLAVAVAAALEAPVAHMDEIFPGWEGLSAAVHLVTEQVLRPIARGEPAAYRVWDWVAGRWGATKELPGSHFLVVEGCGSSVDPAGSYAALRVWVEAPRGVRRRRGLARDGEVFAPHWQRWADQEDAVFTADRTQERADLVVTTAR